MPADIEQLIPKPLSTGNEQDESETPAAQYQSDGRKNYIICIGIGNYEKEKYNLGNFCVNDCKDMIKFLVSEYNFEIVRGLYDEDYNKVDNQKQILLSGYETKGNHNRPTGHNMKNLFERLSYHPDFKKNVWNNETSHNLLIYYSGHGLNIKDIEGRNTFYWVPSDYKREPDDPDPNRLFNVFSLLETMIANTRFHSLVLITDACHSAGTFNLSNRIDSSFEIRAGSVPEKERSAWALCSSAENQESFGSQGERNSFFTKEILDALKRSSEKNIRITTLCENLDIKFEKAKQRPVSGRLNVIKNNTGVFYFRGNNRRQRRIDVCKRKERLQNDLYWLNYDAQKRKAEEINPGGEHILNGRRYLIFLSGCPEYGLKMAHHHIATSEFFPIPYPVQQKVPFLLSISETPKTIEGFIVEVLSSQLDLDLTSDKQVFNKQIKQKLTTAAVIVEMRIDPQTITPENKEAFVKAFYNLLSSLELPDEAYSFCIFLIDGDGTDYDTLTGSFPPGKVEKYVVPKIDDVTPTVFTRWYNVVKGNDTIQKAMFDELFSDVIAIVKKEYLATGKYPPGNFIHALCEKSDCPELTLNILNF